MSRLLKWVLVTVAVMIVPVHTTEAAEWSFHFTYSMCPGGHLEVWATIDCVRTLKVFEGHVVECEEYKGYFPDDPQYNDIVFDFDWDYWCDNEDHIKIAWADWDGDERIWVLRPLPPWIDANLTGPMTVPSIGDPYGVDPNVYVVLDPTVWRAEPRPLRDTYDIVNGRCPDLPGYLIGTTPITFDPNAGEGENPFSTTPLTQTLHRDGEITLTPERDIPTVSEWGLIVMAGLVLAAGTMLIIWRKRRLAV